MPPANPLYEDRRHLRRFPAAELVVSIKSRRGWMQKWRPAKAFDFTRTGLCLITDLDLKPGQSVVLKIILRLDRGEVHQKDVVATVRNKRQEGEDFRYGVLFDYDANRHMRSLKTQARLGRIEGILDRMESLRASRLPEAELLQQYQRPPESDQSGD